MANSPPSEGVCGADQSLQVYVLDLDTWPSVWPPLPFQDLSPCPQPPGNKYRQKGEGGTERERAESERERGRKREAGSDTAVQMICYDQTCTTESNKTFVA